MASRNKKHPCADCRQCQWCSDDRCRLCLKSDCRKKLSIAEQIALFEELNSPDKKRVAKCANAKDFISASD